MKLPTSGKNFPKYLPKVGTGDRIIYDHINYLSRGIMRNSISGVGGSLVKRTSSGTAIMTMSKPKDFVPFLVSTSTNENGERVIVMTLSNANIWAGQGDVKVPANQDFDYASSTLLLPVGDFELGPEFSNENLNTVQTEEYSRYIYWLAKGGGRLVWLELDEDMLKPALRYTDLEVYSKYARDAHAIPIAYVDNFYNIIQINSGTIWADALNLRRKIRHPWQVRLQKMVGTSSTRRVKIEQGSVISYPPAFVNIMGEDGYDVEFPFAIKRGESLGGGWHVNDNESWDVEQDDVIYLQFERDVGSRTYDALGSDDTQWKCTINKGKYADMPMSYYDGNYNTHAYMTCGDALIPNCGSVWTKTTISRDPVPFIPNTYLYLSMQNKRVQLVSDGLLIYPIAKIIMGNDGALDVAQYIKSDFYFQPPLDAHFGFETMVNDFPPHHTDFTALSPNP